MNKHDFTVAERRRLFARGVISLGYVLYWSFMAVMGLFWLLCLYWAPLFTLGVTAGIIAFYGLGTPLMINTVETIGRWAKSDLTQPGTERPDAPPKHR
jgi:hypothetical protein